MKVLHIISSGGMYGAEAVILNLSRALNEGPHRSVIGVFHNASNPNVQLHECAVKEGIESHLIPCCGQMDRAVFGRIRQLVTLTGANVVHAHGYKADLYVYFALHTSTPFVSTCHNWLDDDWKARIYGVADRFVLRSYNGVVAVSEEVRQRLRNSGVETSKISIIRNGIDLRPFDYASGTVKDELGWSTSAMVGLVGRLSVEKGVDIFLTAAALVLKEIPEAKFAVAGDGPDSAALEALIDKLGIRASVRMLGRRTDMPSVYASLDIMVSASRREGLPIAILEGMASRRPLIATSVGEVPTLIRNGDTGILVPAENPELLACAISELLRNPQRRVQLGEAARKLVEDEFSAARMCADYLGTYENAIASAALNKQGRDKHLRADTGNPS